MRLIRSLLASRAPSVLGWIRAVQGHRRYGHQYGEPLQKITQALHSGGRIRVLAGPFAGMRNMDIGHLSSRRVAPAAGYLR